MQTNYHKLLLWVDNAWTTLKKNSEGRFCPPFYNIFRLWVVLEPPWSFLLPQWCFRPGLKGRKSNPQTTQVSIEKATRYPDITFCPSSDFYKKRNNDCNISASDYFHQNQWNGTLNCSDPIKLHKSIVGVDPITIRFRFFDSVFIGPPE